LSALILFSSCRDVTAPLRQLLFASRRNPWQGLRRRNFESGSNTDLICALEYGLRTNQRKIARNHRAACPGQCTTTRTSRADFRPASGQIRSRTVEDRLAPPVKPTTRPAVASGDVELF
jgi:hypothetical protein